MWLDEYMKFYIDIASVCERVMVCKWTFKKLLDTVIGAMSAKTKVEMVVPVDKSHSVLTPSRAYVPHGFIELWRGPLTSYSCVFSK